MTETPSLPLQMRRDGFDPVDALAEARDSEGVVEAMTPFGLPAYLVCRDEDVREVLGDPVRFSSARPTPFGMAIGDEVSEEEKARMRAGNLIGFDPPEHTRLRRMLTPEFTMRRMRRLEPRIAEIVESALDDLERAGAPADLIAHFALPIPSLVICELLGVPYSDRAEFQGRTRRLVNVALPMDQRVAVMRENREYMADLVARARAEPGEDMLGMLVREHGDDLSNDELVGIAGLLLAAGHETTSNMLGLGALAMLRHPDQLAMVRDDPTCIDPAVEELMRWSSVLHSLPPRITTTDVEIAGHAIPRAHWSRVAGRRRPRPGLPRRPRPPRRDTRGRRAPRLRPRNTPLPRGAPGPGRDADRVPGPAQRFPTSHWPIRSGKSSSRPTTPFSG